MITHKKCKMRFYIGLCLLLVWSSSLLAANQTEKLITTLTNLHTMQARFKQNMRMSDGSQQASSGTMALQRPGKFRWQTIKPSGQLLIADGRYVWLYDKDLLQATKQKQDAIPNSPAELLSGVVDDFARQYNIKLLIKSKGGLWYSLRPKDQSGMFKEVKLFIKNNQINQMTILNNLGQRSNIYFSQIKVNKGINPRLFRFVPPKGVDVVESGN